MVFVMRAMFWTALVAVFVPGPSHGTDKAEGLAVMEQWKTDTLRTLARVRLELKAGDLRAR
jgi:hypothetical protein